MDWWIPKAESRPLLHRSLTLARLNFSPNPLKPGIHYSKERRARANSREQRWWEWWGWSWAADRAVKLSFSFRRPASLYLHAKTSGGAHCFIPYWTLKLSSSFPYDLAPPLSHSRPAKLFSQSTETWHPLFQRTPGERVSGAPKLTGDSKGIEPRPKEEDGKTPSTSSIYSSLPGPAKWCLYARLRL